MPDDPTQPEWWHVATAAVPDSDGYAVRIAFAEREPAEIFVAGAEPNAEDLDRLARLVLEYGPPPRPPDAIP